EHPAHPVGRLGGDLEGDLGAERGAPDHGALDAEVVEQRHRLAGEERHRVARPVLGAVGEAVAEQVEGDHPGASLGERGGEGEVHPLREEQPVHEQAGALPVAVDGVREAVPAVGEGGAAAHRDPMVTVDLDTKYVTSYHDMVNRGWLGGTPS